MGEIHFLLFLNQRWGSLALLWVTRSSCLKWQHFHRSFWIFLMTLVLCPGASTSWIPRTLRTSTSQCGWEEEEDSCYTSQPLSWHQWKEFYSFRNISEAKPVLSQTPVLWLKIKQKNKLILYWFWNDFLPLMPILVKNIAKILIIIIIINSTNHTKCLKL